MIRAGGTLVLALAACAATGCGTSDPATAGADLTSSHAEIAATVDLDVLEASGLGARTVDGTLQLLAVGDHGSDLALASELDGFAGTDLSRVVGVVGASGSSQWEAVAGDAAGKVVLLRERPATLFVLDADLELIAEVALDGSTVQDLEWDEDSNSLAEGLVLMRNGHVLVAKESDPPALLELGPSGDAASGFSAGDEASTFPVPTDSAFAALHAWPLSSSAESFAPDVSDLAISPDGELYVLTDEGRGIGRVEANLGADEEHAKLTRTWRLPKKAKKPEGLVFLPDGTPLVAIDSTSANGNGFVLAPLD